MKLIIYIALTALATWTLSQTLKLLFSTLINKRKFRLRNITSDGNYPSSHTGFVTCLTVTSWISTIRTLILYGDADIYVWCSVALTAFAIIVIRDALGVRYTVQKLCESVTKLAEKTEDAEEIKKILDVKSGHKPYEVLGGAALGCIVAAFSSVIYYGLYKYISIVVAAFVAYVIISVLVLIKKRKENTV